MMTVPDKIANRIREGLKRFQPIILNNKAKDINESDTVLLIRDMLSEILGFDKYNDITTEHEIHGTYCDIALKIETKLTLLIEVKAIGITLKKEHVRQAVDYAAHQGLQWVVLTNGIIWKIFKVTLANSVQQILVGEINLLEAKSKSQEDIEKIFVLTKEAISKCSLDEFFNQKQATDKFIIGNLICADTILYAIRKELKLIFPDIKVQMDEIKSVLLNEVIKRELLEGEDSENAQKKIKRVYNRRDRVSNSNSTTPVETGITNNVSTPSSENPTV